MGGVRIQSGASIPNLINLCVDRSVEGEISGRIYHCYTEEPWRFENVVQLLRYLERFYDGIHFPEASVILRNFAGKERQKKPAEWKAVADKKEIMEHRGQCATFYVYVQYRQNASWQGTLVWKEKEREVEFRSALEMIMLVDNALGE